MLVLLQVAPAAVEYTGEFAPSTTLGRDAVSLNGSWQFQPQAAPVGWVPDKGMPPELAPPTAAGWEKTPIKIPSPWNVNTWGSGREVGKGTNHPYWSDSVYFPSYPASRDQVKMGWLRRTFTIPPAWKERRIILHFEAVAGDCLVLVIKVASDQLEGAEPGTLAVRIASSQAEYLRQLDSAIELKNP